jgi:hypothetical protein
MLSLDTLWLPPIAPLLPSILSKGRSCCALSLVTSNDNIYPNIAPNVSPTLTLTLEMAPGFRALQQLSNSARIKANGLVVAEI